jgi:D-alanyl-D-alanine carboxypeptidase (penicillin-binding protein 5/6)
MFKERLYAVTILVVIILALNGFFVFDTNKPASKSIGVDNNEKIEPYKDLAFNVAQAYILPISEPSYVPILNSNISRPEVGAKSALVYDLRSSKFLFAQDPTQRLPIASLTKIMTATAVLENMKLDDVVTVKQDAIRVDGTKQDLYVDEQITVGHLLQYMLIESSNDAAYALASYAKEQGVDLVAKMNDKAAALGMLDTQFLDPAGLNDQAYSSAQDLIKLIRYSLKYQNQIWDVLTQKEINIPSENGKIVHNAKNTDQLLGIIPNIIGGKTGYTDAAQGCLILIVKIPEKNDIIVSILLGSKDRFGDTKTLVDWIQRAYRWN